jgi:hypothetical protein
MVFGKAKGPRKIEVKHKEETESCNIPEKDTGLRECTKT